MMRTRLEDLAPPHTDGRLELAIHHQDVLLEAVRGRLGKGDGPVVVLDAPAGRGVPRAGLPVCSNTTALGSSNSTAPSASVVLPQNAQICELLCRHASADSCSCCRLHRIIQLTIVQANPLEWPMMRLNTCCRSGAALPAALPHLQICAAAACNAHHM